MQITTDINDDVERQNLTLDDTVRSLSLQNSSDVLLTLH
jgi:hypothetical protein